MPQLRLRYFALFREQAGRREETLATTAATPALLYEELATRYGFRLGRAQLQVAVNGAFADWSTPLVDGDEIVFIPPVAGG
jgi:molybdopterin converting factor subunit 1